MKKNVDYIGLLTGKYENVENLDKDFQEIFLDKNTLENATSLKNEFWEEYTKLNASPISRLFSKEKINSMEKIIEEAQRVLNYDIRDPFIDIKGFDTNVEMLNKFGEIVNTQMNSLKNAKFYPKNKTEQLLMLSSGVGFDKSVVHNKKLEMLEIEGYNSELSNNIKQAKNMLERKGLYFASEIYPASRIVSPDNVVLQSDWNTGCDEEKYKYIPTIKDIIDFAEEYRLITRLSPSEIKEIYVSLDKNDFSTDENPYSYSNGVYDLREADGIPYVYIYDDRDAAYDSLSYCPIENKWIGDHEPFVVDNTIEFIFDKYGMKSNLSEQISTTKRISEVRNDLAKNDNKRNKNKFEKRVEQVKVQKSNTSTTHKKMQKQDNSDMKIRL